MEQLLKKPRTQRGLNTLNKILSAAAQVFYENGYGGANVNDIAKLAGIATGTFYIYFDGKYSLYKYLLLQCSHQIRKHLSISTKDCKTRREAERLGLISWLEYIRENPYIYNIIWESLYVDRSLFEGYYNTLCNSYTKGLEEARAKGEVSSIDNTVLSYVLMGATTFLGLKWGLFGGDGTNLDYVADEFMKILDSGMFENPAPQEINVEAAKEIRFNVEMDEEFLMSASGNKEASRDLRQKRAKDA